MNVFGFAFHLSSYVWDIVIKWEWFPKKTVGGQFVEAIDWNEKSKLRKLINEEEYNHIFSELGKLPKSLNRLIKFTNEKLIM